MKNKIKSIRTWCPKI